MKNGLKVVCVGSVFGLLSGCGSDQTPTDASVSITPDVRTFRISEQTSENGACLFDPNSFIDMPFVVSVTNGDGAPLGGVEVSAYLGLADNVNSGLPVVALFEDRNGNGIVDADSELVSDQDDALAVVTTDNLTGDHALLVRANVSCAYSSELFVFSGGLTASASIEVIDGAATTNTGEDAL